jgi:hypothetical protein
MRIMILGLPFDTFTNLHTIISLIGIATGLIALIGMLSSKKLEFWTAIFLLTTVLTSVTGFMFTNAGFTPAQGVGYVSLAVLALALLALYIFKLNGAWRWVYVVAAVSALYLNIFVGIVQAFKQLAFLQPLAPTQSEPPFIIAQVIALLIFVALGILAGIKFHPEATGPM